MKKLVIGDIHGCYMELQELLGKVGLSTDDEIIAIGDIVDRGPDSPRVLNFFNTQPNSLSLMGNHERKHVRSFQGKTRPALSQLITRRQIGKNNYSATVASMKNFPLFLELPEAILVHGFFEPDVPLCNQQEDVIVGTLTGEAYLRNHYPGEWFEKYNGDKPLIVGHRDYLGTGEPLVHEKVFCLDTGCCRGGALTGIILPEFDIVSVPSRKNYWDELKNIYADIRFETCPDESMSWNNVEKVISTLEKQPDVPSTTRERISRLNSMVAETDRLLAHLFNSIMEEQELNIGHLHRKYAFQKLCPREQNRLYAARIGKSPLSGLLHHARKGELTLERLRRRFKKPGDVLEWATHNGLLNQDDKRP